MTAYSARNVWWQCKNNTKHEWQTQIYTRSNGSGYPECNPIPRSRIEIQLAYEISGFLNLDLNDTMIEASGITRDLVVDMKVPQHSHRV